tara:strand:- start:50 stop:526 length:477 start_codon:yes stop_codon:yes gene_type:complete
MNDPPIFPSINLPTQILPNPPILPKPILEIPRAQAPAYMPMIAPPEELRPPVGVPKEGEEEVTEDKKTQTKQENPLPEVRRVNIPWTDIEIPVPKEEIVATAATTAAVSVVATLTATSLFNYLVKIFKPVFMQAVKRIQKKFGKDGPTNETEERPSET